MTAALAAASCCLLWAGMSLVCSWEVAVPGRHGVLWEALQTPSAAPQLKPCLVAACSPGAASAAAAAASAPTKHQHRWRCDSARGRVTYRVLQGGTGDLPSPPNVCGLIAQGKCHLTTCYWKIPTCCDPHPEDSNEHVHAKCPDLGFFSDQIRMCICVCLEACPCRGGRFKGSGISRVTCFQFHRPGCSAAPSPSDRAGG